MSDHIPDPGKHRTLAYGHCAPTFRKRRELLLDLSQSGAEALAEYVRD